MNLKSSARVLAVVAAGSIALTACGSSAAVTTPGTSPSEGGSGSTAPAAKDLKGTLNGAGASTQTAAMEAWNAGFTDSNPDATFNYDAVGSGSGREQFLAGGNILFAGSDAPLKKDEAATAKTRCNGSDAIEIPAYISPIAIAYNLDGVKNLNLTPAVLAGIFNQKITNWNAPEIKADNPDASLPDLKITPVNRADKSGTTENFTTYLADAAKDAWPYPESQVWPVSGGEAADKTSGVVAAITAGKGAIGYADASQVRDPLGVAKIKVGDSFVGPSAEGAAALVDLSPRVEGLPAGDIVVKLDRATTDSSAYPVSLVSYLIACGKYGDTGQSALVKGFLSYVISKDGQEAAAKNAGSAPIGDKLRADAEKAVASIS